MQFYASDSEHSTLKKLTLWGRCKKGYFAEVDSRYCLEITDDEIIFIHCGE